MKADPDRIAPLNIAVAGGNTLAQMERIAAPGHSETLAHAFALPAVVRQIVQRIVQQIKRTYSTADCENAKKAFAINALSCWKICENGGDEVCETVFRRVPQKTANPNEIRLSTPSKFRQLPPYALLFPLLLGGWMEGQWPRT
ncbi:MAG: hypothetical protein R3D78_01000 [Paracoccaceae bacterium]